MQDLQKARDAPTWREMLYVIITIHWKGLARLVPTLAACVPEKVYPVIPWQVTLDQGASTAAYASPIEQSWRSTNLEHPIMEAHYSRTSL
jgi:hypothetical protein